MAPSFRPSAVGLALNARRHLPYDAPSSDDSLLLDDVDPIAQETFGDLLVRRVEQGRFFAVVQTEAFRGGRTWPRHAYEASGWGAYIASTSPLFFPLGVNEPVTGREVDQLFLHVFDPNLRPGHLAPLAVLLEPNPASFAHFASLSLLDLASTDAEIRLSGALSLAPEHALSPLPQNSANRAFFRAVICGQRVAAAAALTAGADIQSTFAANGREMTGLAWAAFLGHGDLAGDLIERSAMCCPPAERYYQSPLHCAALWGDRELYARLVAGGAPENLALACSWPQADESDSSEDGGLPPAADLVLRRAASLVDVDLADDLLGWARAWRNPERFCPQPQHDERRSWRLIIASARTTLEAEHPTAA